MSLWTASQARSEKTVDPGLGFRGHTWPVSESGKHKMARVRLHRDLREYLIDRDGFRSLVHPLIYTGVYFPRYNPLYNTDYQRKKAILQGLMQADSIDWQAVLDLHTRWYRLEVLDAHADRMSDADYWRLLAYCYADSEHVSQQRDLIDQLFSSARPGRENLMNLREREYLEGLPDQITLYRGYDAAYPWDTSMSYTLSRDRAEWFARRDYCSSPAIVTGTAARSDIIAYLAGRDEDEILIRPGDLRDPQITYLPDPAV